MPHRSARTAPRPDFLPILALVGTMVLAAAGCSASATPPGTRTVEDGVVTVTVDMIDMRFDPAVIEVAAGTHLVLDATNTDGMPHDLVFDGGPGTSLLARGEQESVDLGVVTEDREGWCTVSGHRAAGMTLDVRVDR